MILLKDTGLSQAEMDFIDINYPKLDDETKFITVKGGSKVMIPNKNPKYPDVMAFEVKLDDFYGVGSYGYCEELNVFIKKITRKQL